MKEFLLALTLFIFASASAGVEKDNWQLYENCKCLGYKGFKIRFNVEADSDNQYEVYDPENRFIVAFGSAFLAKSIVEHKAKQRELFQKGN